MKDLMTGLMVFIGLLILAFIVLAGVVIPQEQYVYGHIRIQERGIYAQVCTAEEAPDCGCCDALYGGGKVTVKADLSAVQVGDMAELTSLAGDRMVLECIDIRHGLSWGMKTEGDVLVINDRLIFRFTRL